MHFTAFDPPILPTRIIALVLVAVLIAIGFYWRGERKATGRARGVLAALRTATLLLIGLVLLNPSVTKPTEAGQGKPPFFVLIDASRSMGVSDVEGRSRFAAAKQAVLENKRLLGQLGASWDLRTYVFDAGMKRTALEQARAIERPMGESTELGKALVDLASEASQYSGSPAGALLISDGRDNGTVSPLAAAGIARSAGLPIWTFCLGTQSTAKDIAVLTYASQTFAFARQRTSLSADIQQKGYGATTLTATLGRNGAPLIQQAVSFTGDGRQTVHFPVTEAHPGLYRYTISVDPLRDEMSPRNNSRSVFLHVANDKVKVLLIDARPSWDTKFLGETLRKDPNVELTAIYRLSGARDFCVTTEGRKPAPGQGPKGQAKRLEAPRARLPRQAEELFPYDVVIVGKGFEDLLTEAGVGLLKRYLLERGGSVVFFRGRADAGTEKLRDLEPLVWSSDEVRNLQLALTEDGRQNPAFSFPTTENAQTVIRKLPDLISATRVKAEKSFAVVLARGVGKKGLNEPMAAVAYQRYGAGRVMALAGQGLWRWTFLPEDLQKYNAVYRAFWAQMLRWLVGGSDFLPGQDFSLKTDRLSSAPGERVHLLVFSKRGPHVDVNPKLEVFDPDGESVWVTPARSQAFGATFVGAYTPSKTGDYKVVLRTGPREVDKTEAAFTVHESRQEDMITEADPELMRQIAEASGGRVATPQDLLQLPQSVKHAERRMLLTEQRVPTWDRPWVFLLFCTLFGTEWYLRRRQGLC